jgi:hypothetical protein
LPLWSTSEDRPATFVGAVTTWVDLTEEVVEAVEALDPAETPPKDVPRPANAVKL